MNKTLTRNISKKILLTLIAVYAFSLTIVTISQAWAINGLNVGQKLINDYGYSQRVAYEGAVSYCNSVIKTAACKDLLIQSSAPYTEEYGSGIVFIFSNTRHEQKDSIVIEIDMSSKATVKSTKQVNSAVLDNIPLP